MKLHPVTNSERRWVLIFSFLVVVLTSLSYALAYTRQPESFTGFLFAVEDGNSYIAKMMLGAQGDWLFHSPYSTVNQHGALLYLPYLLLGKLLGPSTQHASLVLLFHIFRAFSIVALCFAVYEFIALFIAKINLRRLGLALATLGGGLGWLLVLAGKPGLLGLLPLDFYSPETFGFLAVFGLPHLVLARALLLWGLIVYLHASQPSPRIWLHSLLWLALALTHLITAGLGLLLIALHLLVVFIWQRRLPKRTQILTKPRLIYAACAALDAAPVFLYNIWVFRHDAYLPAWASLNQILSPNPLHYLIAYGWLLPFVYFGLRHVVSKDLRTGSFLATWLLALPVLLYLPFGLQRRLAEGAWVMLVTLALILFDQEWAKRKQQLWLFALAAPSTLILYLGATQAALQSAPPIFIPASEAAAFNELRQQAKPGAVVLAPYGTSNALPAWTPLRVLGGHGPEGVGPKQLATNVVAFYDRRLTDEQRLQFLTNNNVDYVFWGPYETSLGKWDPHQVNYLESVVSIEGYEFFAVKEP